MLNNRSLHPFILIFSDGFDTHKHFKENNAFVGNRAKKTSVVRSSNHRGGLPYDEHGAMLQQYGHLVPNIVILLTLLFIIHGTIVGMFAMMGMVPHHGLF